MKRILGIIAIIGVGGLAVVVPRLENSISVTNTTATSTEEVSLPEWASDTEAVEAAQAVMRKKVLTEEVNVLEGDIEALTATYEAQLNELNEQKVEKEKELKTY